MKISSLRLTNFRSHQKTELALDRVTIIRGVNGSGKSSYQDALEFLFTGATRQTDAGGRGADLLIQHGKNELGVQATFEAGTEITRLRNRAGGTFMVRQPGKVDCVGKLADAWMQMEFFPEPVLQACLNSGRFLSLSDKDQKALLTSALASKPVPIPKEITESIRLATQPVPDIALGEITSATHAENVYDFFFKLRTDLNRQIKALGDLTAPEIPVDAPDPATVRQQLAAVRKERDGYVTGRSTRQADHKANRSRIESARAQYDQFKTDILPDSEIERLRKIGGNASHVAKVTAEIEALNASINQDRAVVAQIKDAPSTCPTCGQAVDHSDATEQLNELEKKITEAEKSRGGLQVKLTKLGDPATAQQKLDAHKKAVVSTGSAERTLRELEGFQPECDVSGLDAKIAECDSRLANGEQVLAEVQTLEGAKQQYDQAARKKGELAKRVLAAEKVIEAFGPAGPIRAQLVGDGWGDFKIKLFTALAQFRFGLKIELEPYSIHIRQCWDAIEVLNVPGGELNGVEINAVNCGDWLTPRQLSESEAFRFSVAFQIALAEATGMNFVVIDRSDMLLVDLRSTLLEMLLNSKLDQAIVLVAGEPMRFDAGALPPETKLIDLDKDQQGHTTIAAEYICPVRETVYEEMA